MTIRVAGAQLAVSQDIDVNVAAISRALEFAAVERADILLTPEGSLSGYTPHFDRKAAAHALGQITSLAREKNIGLALGTCFVEEEDQKCYNQIRFYQPDGVYLGFHSKTLTCGTMTQRPRGEINDYAVAPLRTFDFENIAVGGLICNDMWANPSCTPQPDPHLAYQLSKQGVRILFHAVFGGRNGDDWSQMIWQFHESNLRIRARASKLWVVTVDSAEPVEIPTSAPSGVIDPDGNWVCRTPRSGEQFFAHTIELE